MNIGIKKEKIKVLKTAYVSTYGKLNTETKAIWLVFHGYGYLSEYFIRKFTHLPSSYILVAEGLSHFYLEGFSGKVGANWMTAYEREDEIADYIAYINQVVEKYIPNNKTICKINVVGFSQGAATASRWYQQTKLKVNNFIIWSNVLEKEDEDVKFLQNHIYFVHGDKDEFILKNEKMNNEFKQYLKEKSSSAKIIEFDGGHEIPKDVIADLNSKYWT